MVTEVLANGQRFRGFVYAAGEMLATQYEGTQHVVWEHRDATNQSMRMTGDTGYIAEEAELNSTGANVGLADPYPADPGFTGDDTDGVYPHYGSPTRPGTGCLNNGIPVPCAELMRHIANRAEGVRSYRVETAAVFHARGSLTIRIPATVADTDEVIQVAIRSPIR